jgi:hypothetical protein
VRSAFFQAGNYVTIIGWIFVGILHALFLPPTVWGLFVVIETTGYKISSGQLRKYPGQKPG